MLRLAAIAAAAAALPGASAQTQYDGYAPSIAACQRSLPSNTVMYVFNGTATAGVPREGNLDSTAGNLGFSGTCAGFAVNSQPKNVFAINLGSSVNYGGTFTVNTCNLGSIMQFDSVLYVGTGCPSSLASFNCIAGNDDAQQCVDSGFSSLHSFVVAPNLQTSVIYVVLSSWSGTTASTSRYSFQYAYYNAGNTLPSAPPTPSNPGTRSVTPPGTPSGSTSVSSSSSVSQSVAPSPSGTPSTSRNVALTPTNTPSFTRTSARTPSNTPPITNTPLGTVSPRATPTGSPSQTATLSPPSTSSASRTATPSLTSSASGTSSSIITPTRSGTVAPSSSFTATPSSTVTGTASPSHTPSSAVTQTLTETATSTVTGTPSASATALPSSTATPSARATASPTTTRLPTHTRSPTPSPPTCRGLPVVHILTGTSGVTAVLSTASSGCAGMYTAGTCASGFRTFYPGSRLVYQLSLGDAAPLGGTLTVTTCGHTANNTVLYVGTGCPNWDSAFGCLAGNDDVLGGASVSCGGNPLASTVAVTASQRTYYIQLGGVDGRAVTTRMAWTYARASSSHTAPASKTRSASRTRSPGGSRSRSRKAK